MSRSQRRRFAERLAAAAVAACLACVSTAGVAHRHGPPGDPSRPTSAKIGRDRVEDGKPCLACRLSHEQASLFAAPPSVVLPVPPPARFPIAGGWPRRPESPTLRASRAPPASPLPAA